MVKLFSAYNNNEEMSNMDKLVTHMANEYFGLDSKNMTHCNEVYISCVYIHYYLSTYSSKNIQ